MEEVVAFAEESDDLRALVESLSEEQMARPTQFKGWTINDVLQHLHVWNEAATLSAADPDRFESMVLEMRATPGGLRAFEQQWTGDLRGRALLELWSDGTAATADRFSFLDPKTRLPWVGPSMSARSSITARQMEAWAHGHEIYDMLGVRRLDGERLQNIAHLGVATFAWAFKSRGFEVPLRAPYVELRAPSGAIWSWGCRSDDDRIVGDATAFCEVVTHTRSPADVALDVIGPVASRWIGIAQCFAGPPQEQPAPGSRFVSDGSVRRAREAGDRDAMR